MQRRQLLTAAAAAVSAVGLGTVAGCSRDRGENEILLWGVGGTSRDYQADVVKAFTDANPQVSIAVNNVPGTGDGDATKVITAVRGGTAPDLWWMDRFSCAQYAALGLLEPIDDLIAEYEEPGFMDQYLPFAANELRLNGQVYGLPTSTDTRVLYYNKRIVAEAGFDPDELDPSNGAPTVERVVEMSNAMIKLDGTGSYTQLGLIPWADQGWGYTWSLGNKATFFDDATCGIDLTASPILQAYEFLYDWTRENDYNKVDAFKATYQPPNAPPAQTSFLGQQQGFVINTNGYRTASVEKYAPQIDLGYTNLPVFADGNPLYTWSGGFALVMPKGGSRSRAAWEFMKFYAGVEGQKIYIPRTGGLPTHKELQRDAAFPGAEFFFDQLDYSTSRPPFPVSQIWWESMSNAQESVKLGSLSARDALQVAQDRVAPQMNLYCPFQMPEGFGRTGA